MVLERLSAVNDYELSSDHRGSDGKKHDSVSNIVWLRRAGQWQVGDHLVEVPVGIAFANPARIDGAR